MKAVIDQVSELLRQGTTVKGSLELPDSLVLWQLSYDGSALKFEARDYIYLDDPIPLDLSDEPASDQDPPE